METCSSVVSKKEKSWEEKQKDVFFENYFGEDQHCICCCKPSVYSVSIGTKSVYCCANTTCKGLAEAIVRDRNKKINSLN